MTAGYINHYRSWFNDRLLRLDGSNDVGQFGAALGISLSQPIRLG
ncbi:MAG: hypothetical protein ACREU6_11100 [Steroidobacteraceae bacterium]